MNRVITGLVVAGLASTSLAACSGSAPSATALPAASTAVPSSAYAPQSVGRVLLSFHEPRSTSGDSRTRQFLSFAAQSVSIVTDGGTPTTLQLANCSSDLVGSQLVCPAIGFTAPAGAHSFVVTAYDGKTGTGNVLGTATVSMTVAANATTPMNLSLFGVPKFAVLRLDNSTAPFGPAAFVTMTVKASDADGYTILGQFTSPVAVTKSNDPGNAITLDKTTLISSSDKISVGYNGAKLASPVVFTPSAPQVTAFPVSFSNFSSRQPLLVTTNSNTGNASEDIVVYDPTINGTQQPLFESSGTNGKPGDGSVAFAQNGDIYYAAKSAQQLKVYQNYQSSAAAYASVDLETAPTGIAVSSSDQKVIVTSSTSSFFTDAASDTALDVEVTTLNNLLANNVYQSTFEVPVANETYPIRNAPNNVIAPAFDAHGQAYVPGSDGIDRVIGGNIQTISYGGTIKGVTDMAFDKSSGKLWVCDATANDVVGIPKGSQTADGSQIITGPYVQGCSHIRVDSTGAVYVKTSYGQNATINVFPTAATGNATPTRVLTLANSFGNFDLINI